MKSIDTSALDRRERYQLLISLVVPRPIAWVGTRSAAGAANLAPFSYYAALSATPMLIGVSIGNRAGAPKDTLRNIRETEAFCVSVVSVAQIEAMNATSADLAPEMDEAAHAGVALAESGRVAAPYVVGAPAVLECVLFKEVPLGDSTNSLVIGEVRGVLLAPGTPLIDGTSIVDSAALEPVARLWGDLYAELGPVRALPRPR